LLPLRPWQAHLEGIWQTEDDDGVNPTALAALDAPNACWFLWHPIITFGLAGERRSAAFRKLFRQAARGK
jgi:hypothetical protein